MFSLITFSLKGFSTCRTLLKNLEFYWHVAFVFVVPYNVWLKSGHSLKNCTFLKMDIDFLESPEVLSCLWAHKHLTVSSPTCPGYVSFSQKLSMFQSLRVNIIVPLCCFMTAWQLIFQFESWVLSWAHAASLPCWYLKSRLQRKPFQWRWERARPDPEKVGGSRNLLRLDWRQWDKIRRKLTRNADLDC